MTRTVEDIASLWKQRKDAQGPVLAQMLTIRNAYNADLVVPLPELDASEKPAIANIVAQGTDQLGMRIASTVPGLYFPPTSPGNRASERRANTRRRATLGWWEANRMQLKLRRRARHLIAYSTSPVVLRPDSRRGISRWEIRDPLSTYPAPSTDPDELAPADCIFSYPRNYAWIKSRYPTTVHLLNVGQPHDKVRPDAVFDLLEYVDGDETVLIVVGQHRANTSWQPAWGPQQYVELERVVNRTGLCPAVVPSRITLDRPRGQFDDIPNMMQWTAKLMALELIATEKGVFPDSYLISRPNETAQFVSGPHDGRSGEVNIVRGGDMKEINSAPGYQTNPTIDRLEKAARVTGGIPPEFGGESQGSIRTGKRGDAVMSAVVDFPVQEAQELLAASLECENKIAVAQALAYFGEQRKSFYVSAKGAQGNVDYVPNRDFGESDDNRVVYAQAGSDANALVISGGQRVGIGTLSKRSFMELDPLVDDPEREHDRVVGEALEAALLQSVQTQASQGAIPPADLARIMQLVVMDKMELAQAIDTVHKEAQARQASMADAAAGAPEAPVDPNSPEAQPGLGAPGQGAEAGTGPIGPPPPSSSNLAGLLSSLRSPQRMLPSERGAAVR